MAFGTGTHETTQLCLQAIGDNYRAGQTFLDIGTGTGILAIAAAKLATESTENTREKNKGLSGNSVAKILGCDIDADSVNIARENAIANGVGDSIEFIQGSINDKTPVFDFVCANLTVDVIQPMLPLLLAKTGEKLVLSGILVEQKNIISAELQKFEISTFEIQTAGEWLSVVISVR